MINQGDLVPITFEVFIKKKQKCEIKTKWHT